MNARGTTRASATPRLLLGSGRYFDGLRPGRAHAQAYDERARARPRALSEALVGLVGGPPGRGSEREDGSGLSR